jgi:hypothetical protein
MPTTKCILSTTCEWNGELVDWKGNKDDRWKSLNTKPRYIILFKITIILKNVLQGCWIDFTFGIIGKKMFKFVNHGWDGDF